MATETQSNLFVRRVKNMRQGMLACKVCQQLLKLCRLQGQRPQPFRQLRRLPLGALLLHAELLQQA